MPKANKFEFAKITFWFLEMTSYLKTVLNLEMIKTVIIEEG